MQTTTHCRPKGTQVFDPHPHLLNTPEGVVDLRTGQVSPHDPELYVTPMTAGNYRPGLTHPDWTSACGALAEPEMIRYMQYRLGQAVTGHCASDMMLLVGKGSNGKSLLLHEGILPALGGYAMSVGPLLIPATTEHGASSRRSQLRGARLILIEELPEGKSLSVAEIKRLMDTLTPTEGQLYGAPVTFNTAHTILATSNHSPLMAQADRDARRGFCQIPFPLRYTDTPMEENDRKGDPQLGDRLRAGLGGQHDACITWLVEGAMKYFAQPELMSPASRPESVRVATQQW